MTYDEIWWIISIVSLPSSIIDTSDWSNKLVLMQHSIQASRRKYYWWYHQAFWRLKLSRLAAEAEEA